MATLKIKVALQSGTVTIPAGTELEGKNLAIYLRKQVSTITGETVNASVLPTDRVMEVFNLCGGQEDETIEALAAIVKPKPQSADDDTIEPTATPADVAATMRIAGTIRDRMVNYASKLDERFDAAVDAFVLGKENVAMGPIEWLSHLMRVHGGRADMAGDVPDYFAKSCDWLDGLPVPGTEQEKAKNGKPVPLGNKLVDWYYTFVQGTNGNRQTLVSAYSDMFNASHRGKAWQQIISEIDLAKANSDKAPAKYRKMRELVRNAERAKYATRLTAGRTNLARAVELGLKMRALNQMPLVGARFVLDQDENGNDITTAVKVCGKPIVLFEKVPAPNGGYNERNAEAKGVGYILSIDIDKAIAEGGKLSDVNNNAGRETGEDAGQLESMLKSTTDYNNAMVNDLLFLQDADHYSAVLQQFKTKGDARDRLILQYGDYIKFMLAIWANIEKDYETLAIERNANESKAEENRRRLAEGAQRQG